VTENAPAPRIGDADREHAAARLRHALAEGRITLGEFDERVASVYAARTRPELDVLFADLPADPVQTPDLPVPEHSGSEPVPRGEVANTVAVFASTVRRGAWRVPERTNAVAVLGSVELDLREAVPLAAQVTIVASAILGSIEIIVPDGADVDLHGVAFLGDKSARTAPAVPGGLQVRVQATAVLGSISVTSKPRPAQAFGALPLPPEWPPPAPGGKSLRG
jgi:hypothetical protein